MDTGTPQRGQLPTRPLGRTGYQVSVLGVGGWLGRLEDPALSAADRERAAIAAVRRAVELGVIYFDTSPAYGPNVEAERHLGLGLRALGGAERARLRVATKTGTHPARRNRYDADSTRWSVDQSLRNLFAKSIDVLLVHDPRDDADLDAALAPGGAVETLERLKTDGVVGAIGLGVRTHRFLRRAIESGRFDVILTPYDYTLLRASAAPVIELAVSHDVGVINGSPYGAGLLAGIDPDVAAQKRQPLSAPDLARARALWRWCRDHDLDLGAVAMQYSLRHPGIATTLVGPRTAEEVDGNLRHATTPLPETLWAELDSFMESLGPPAPGGEAK
ncbi:MAG TPA: aldo/keto reductase [Chloroflexota bacterium]|nr:aldo/keto reductase [Chloroflexota bacterium]